MMRIIEFHKSDWEYPDLEAVASDIAQFIHNRKSFLPDLNTFMRISSQWWKRNKEKSEFQKWRSGYILNPKKVAPDKLQFAELLTKILDTCQNEDDWNKMRGLIPEKIFELFFSAKHLNADKGFGVVVSINQERVIYQPQSLEEGDGRRQTVDAGSWDGTYGEFAEVKFQPDGFQRKEFGYLHLLEERLGAHSIDHRIYLVTFDKEINFVRRMLEARGLLPVDSRFRILGREDIINGSD